MNKSALKKFATEARKELLDRVKLQARKIGITEEMIQKANIESSDAVYIDGIQLSDVERRQRNKLIKRIEEIGFDRVMEETAYTWFNRFIALRFMEVNDYLPTKVRVLSSYNADSAEPDMMKEALSLDLELDKQKIYDLKMANNTDELFKYLIKVHCNDLNRYMPFMFETIEDYKEILFPEGLLGTDSFVRQMTNTQNITESDWESVEIIGWLYQYYISEEKDEVFANLKKNIKISKDKIPAATQLFTPNWIVRYMVENSLGKIWIESYPESNIKEQWKYYLDNIDQKDSLKEQLKCINYEKVNVEEIKFIDPCCGSGHILVYAFDIFYEMYTEKGYMENEIPELIIRNNLFGLDIDDRAVQLASFAIFMKAREKSRRIFRKATSINIYAIQESNWLKNEMIDKISKNEEVIEIFKLIRNTFLDAKEYGALLNINVSNLKVLEDSFEEYKNSDSNLLELIDKEIIVERLPSLIYQTKLLSQKYDVVCTNPPYMGRSGMNSKLTDFLNLYYKDSKSDLFATFIEKGFNLSKENGFNSIVTMQSWMFLKSYQQLREKIIQEKVISSLLHMDNMVMGIAFGTAATIYRNTQIKSYKAYYNEVLYKDIQLNGIPHSFPVKHNKNYISTVEKFKRIPGSPIAYWISENLIRVFDSGDKMSDLVEPKVGLQTGDNNKFLKLWWEVNNSNISFTTTSIEDAKYSNKKWVPYNKGGERRQWYGNYDYLVNWGNSGYEIKNFKNSKGKLRSVVRSPQYYFKEAITWSDVTNGGFSIRYRVPGSIHDVTGMSAFTDDSKLMKYLLGLMSTKIADYIFKILNPTVHLQIGDFGNFPVIYEPKIVDKVINLVEENLKISKEEWDYYENSWDFHKPPLIAMGKKNLEEAYSEWQIYMDSLFNKLKSNEEDLNKIFIDIYGLKDLNYNVCDNDITLRKANLLTDIKSLISYVIGCILGRYSFEVPKVSHTKSDCCREIYRESYIKKDNILPLLNDEYFSENATSIFIEYIKLIFGEDLLEENMKFIAKVLGGKSTETPKETILRYFLTEFYNDHLQVYKKRPIYWLFSSGKEKAFNCLIYMHRYDKTTLSRIRTEYLHEVQIRMDAEKKELLAIISGDYTQKEITAAKKELKALDKKIDELKAYDEKLHHMADMQIEIDLDDGVKHNYELFKGLVAKI